VTPEAFAALIARQQQKRRDELTTMTALEVICLKTLGLASVYPAFDTTDRARIIR